MSYYYLIDPESVLALKSKAGRDLVDALFMDIESDGGLLLDKRYAWFHLLHSRILSYSPKSEHADWFLRLQDEIQQRQIGVSGDGQKYEKSFLVLLEIDNCPPEKVFDYLRERCVPDFVICERFGSSELDCDIPPISLQEYPSFSRGFRREQYSQDKATGWCFDHKLRNDKISRIVRHTDRLRIYDRYIGVDLIESYPNSRAFDSLCYLIRLWGEGLLAKGGGRLAVEVLTSSVESRKASFDRDRCGEAFSRYTSEFLSSRLGDNVNVSLNFSLKDYSRKWKKSHQRVVFNGFNAITFPNGIDSMEYCLKYFAGGDPGSEALDTFEAMVHHWADSKLDSSVLSELDNCPTLFEYSVGLNP